MQGVFRVGIRRSFSAAHSLRGYQGSCEALHGHNWHVEVELEARELNELGLAWDFREIKARLDEILGELDHRFINEHPYFADRNPSAEELARFVYRRLSEKAPPGLQVALVRVFESEGSWASYREE